MEYVSWLTTLICKPNLPFHFYRSFDLLRYTDLGRKRSDRVIVTNSRSFPCCVGFRRRDIVSAKVTRWTLNIRQRCQCWRREWRQDCLPWPAYYRWLGVDLRVFTITGHNEPSLGRCRVSVNRCDRDMTSLRMISHVLANAKTASAHLNIFHTQPRQ